LGETSAAATVEAARPRVAVTARDRERASELGDMLSAPDLDVRAVATTQVDGMVTEERPHLVLLESGLSTSEELALVERLHARGGLSALVVMAAEQDELRSVALLDAGADLVLPRSTPGDHLRAHVRALLRRGGRAVDPVPGPDEPEPPAQVTLSLEARDVRVDGRVVELTDREFDVLRVLAVNAGAVVTRRRLEAEGWNDRPIQTKTVDRTVCTLRRALRREGAPLRVSTVRGIGFRLDGSVPTVER